MIHFIKLLLKNLKWLVLVPVICAATVFFLTRKSKKEYSSSTTLYTGVASGYSITSTEDERLDYFAVNNAFDNLLASAKSRETIEQVAMHLLAEHLTLRKPDAKVLGAEGFDALQKLAGKDLLAKAKQLKTPDAIYTYLNQLYESKPDNVVAGILNQPGTYYNLDDLRSNLVVSRITTSDIIQILYTCSDPAVCQRTLQIHTEIFNANYRRVKNDQTNSAVQYFEAKLAEVKAKLQKAEDDMKAFGKQNHIINYYEQTRYIAAESEQLKREIYGQKILKNAADDGMALVQRKLNSRDKQISTSTAVINLGNKLSAANASLDRARVFGDASKISQISADIKVLEDSVRQASTDYNNLNYTLETVPRTSLMQEWVDNAVNSGKAKAGLQVLNGEKRDYMRNFDEFAPLGSTLKRLERQIDINEKEFLSILHGLELARLRQSNLALNSNITVQDKPFLPLKAQKSTRALLVMVAFFTGLILSGSTVIGRELMDSSIRTPERAENLLGLKLAGISISHQTRDKKSYLQPLQLMLAEQLVSNVLTPLKAGTAHSGIAQLTLLRNKEGVFNTADVKLINELLGQLFANVHWVIPANEVSVFEPALPVVNYSTYVPAIAHLNYSDVRQLMQQPNDSLSLVVYVAPNITQNSLPQGILQKTSMGLFVVNANDTWLPVDKEHLAKLKNLLPAENLGCWLVNTDENNLDSVIGELPKQRSWLRKKIKKVITLNLR